MTRLRLFAPLAFTLFALPSAALPAGARADATAQNPHHDPVTEQGQRARGIYIGAGFVRRAGAEAVISTVRNTNSTAVVIDLKDAEGQVHFDTAVPELAEARTGWLGDAAAMVERLHEEDIYVVARITCFADRNLPERHPERAIQQRRHPGNAWVSWGTGGTWLDPYNPDNHRMIVALTREAQALGFDEVQLDYVRFPVDDGTEFAVYPSERDEPRSDVLMGLLAAIDRAISIPLGVDVFGLAAYRRGDPSGLGQDLEAWTRHVEVFTPMLYVNSMRNWRRGEANRTFSLVFNGVHRLRQRVGPQPVIRPFLQAFAQGADHFDAEFIFEQVRASRRGAADGFLWWNPGHSYSMVRRGMRGRVRGLLPFPISPETVERRTR